MIEDKLKRIMSKILKINASDINADSSPDNIDTWDSLMHMNLVLSLEQNFSVSFDDEEIIQLLSYEIILATLDEKL